jgi:hypothetical protein
VHRTPPLSHRPTTESQRWRDALRPEEQDIPDIPYIPTATHVPEEDEEERGATPQIPSAGRRTAHPTASPSVTPHTVSPTPASRSPTQTPLLVPPPHAGPAIEPRREFEEPRREFEEPRREFEEPRRGAGEPRRGASEPHQEAGEPSGPLPPHPTVTVVPSEAYSGPGDLDFADAERERADRFSQLAHQMGEQLQIAEDAEDERERIFRENEEARQRMYLDREERRDQEALQHRDEALRDVDGRIHERLASIPTMPAAAPGGPALPEEQEEIRPGAPVEEEAPEFLEDDAIPVRPPEPEFSPPGTPVSVQHEDDGRTLAQSIQSQVAEAASRHAQDIMETVRLEREEMAAARAEMERIRAELDAERERRMVDLAAQSDALREEIAGLKAENEQLKNDLEQERQLRITEDNALRESERAEDRQRAENLELQLTHVTNIVSETREEVARKREVSDERWAQKEAWHTECNTQMDDMKSMFQNFQRMFEEEQRARQAEREEQANKPSAYGDGMLKRDSNERRAGIETIVAQLREENAQLRTLLQELSDGKH